MTKTDPSAALVAAIHDQRAAQVASELMTLAPSDATAMARDVVAACAAISRRMLSVRKEVLQACQIAGVAVTPVPGPEDRDALQHHQTALRIAASDLGSALTALAPLGFHLPFQPTAGQAAALGRYVPSVTLVRGDAVTARVVLHLEGAGSGFPDKMRPRMADIAAQRLPAAAGWAYPAVRLARVARNRLSRHKAPLSDIDFLGTPDSLIAPLLNVVAPGPQDNLLDLGCGDGRIVLAAARDFGCRAEGVEANPALVAAAGAARAALDPAVQQRVEIRAGFAEEADLSHATIIFLFLPTYVLSTVLPRVLRRARPGTRILVHEQTRLGDLPAPSRTQAVVSDEAISVAHVWVVP
ncbi:class I SAM-dependent methyltransferase [Fluviibacterium sp. DFM31]|uniref:Class I SAM-dependent methyltransferase n=1 Tax=Meridianimarinicoccus marinus TaxID=3231483 RepID=A0ABV3L5W6_9RHOB